MWKVGPVTAFDVPDRSRELGASALAATARLTVDSSDTFELPLDHELFPVYARILKRRLEAGEPVAVEHFGDQIARRIALPQMRRVGDVTEVKPGRDVVVRTAGSSIPFLLRRHLRDNFLESLREAAKTGRELLITDDPETHEILDVRTEARSASPASLEPIASLPREPTLTPLSALHVREVIRDLSAQADIPFDYPDEGCTARAHRMFSLLNDQGIGCGKIWSFGKEGDRKQVDQDMNFYTLNHPNGFVPWVFHVAVLVAVELPNRKAVRMVMDPCMFDRPARVAEWVALQHDTATVLQVTVPDIYRHWLGEEVELDRDFTRTETELITYRELRDMRRRSLGLC